MEPEATSRASANRPAAAASRGPRPPSPAQAAKRAFARIRRGRTVLPPEEEEVFREFEEAGVPMPFLEAHLERMTGVRRRKQPSPEPGPVPVEGKPLAELVAEPAPAPGTPAPLIPGTTFLLFVIATLPILLIGALLARYLVDFPWGTDWSLFAPSPVAAASSPPPPETSSSGLLVSDAMEAFLIRSSAGGVATMAWLSLGLTLSASSGLLLLLLRTFGWSPQCMLSWLLVNLILFQPADATFRLSAMQLQHAFALNAFVWCLIAGLLPLPAALRLFICGGFAVLASLSSPEGIGVWLAVACVFWPPRSPGRSLAAFYPFAIWLSIATGFLGTLFFFSAERPALTVQVLESHVVQSLAMLGVPFQHLASREGNDPWLSFVGMVFAVTFLVLLVLRSLFDLFGRESALASRDLAWIWLAASLFATAFALPLLGNTPPATPFPLLWLFAAAVLVLLAGFPTTLRPRFLAALFQFPITLFHLGLLLWLSSAWIAALPSVRENHQARLRNAALVHFAPAVPGYDLHRHSLDPALPPLDTLRSLADRGLLRQAPLQSAVWTGFRARPAPLPSLEPSPVLDSASTPDSSPETGGHLVIARLPSGRPADAVVVTGPVVDSLPPRILDLAAPEPADPAAWRLTQVPPANTILWAWDHELRHAHRLTK